MAPIGRPHDALANPNASALPALLADIQQHLHGHPDLAGQVGAGMAHTEQVRQTTQQWRDVAGVST